MEYWKSKLTHILHSTQFCGICLCTDDSVNSVYDQFDLVVCDNTHTTTLADILHVVFGETDLQACSQICNSCIKKLIQSYIFIQQARETLKIVTNCINDLFNKTCYIHDNIIHTDHTGSNHYNIVIALDKNNLTEKFDNDRNKIKGSEKDEIKINLNKRLERFKCLMCNVILPSYKAWKLHETTSHKNKLKCKICTKIFKSQKCLINHCKTHLKPRCKICLRVVQEGRILPHLKEYHENLSCLCSICNVAFYSIKDLEAHKQEWHYKEVSKCLTCLKSYSESELEQHQCRFGCGSCAEVPCVHHKYLMCYREQILNGARRPKCLDCQYTSRSKEALLTHINTSHLSKYLCDSCDGKFNKKSDLNTHIQNLHKTMCRICLMEFTNPKIYENHIKDCEVTKKGSVVLHAPKSDNKLKTFGHRQDIFPCGICSKMYFNDFEMKRHMIKSHGGLQNKKRAILDCVVCQKKFTSKRNLIHHMKSHGPNVQYPCRICNTQYETLRQFRAHNRKHIGPFAVCEVCGKEMRQILLKKHMTTHTDSPMTCETCGKSFQNTALLKYHQKVHLESVPCPKCDKPINPAKLRRHYKNHLIQEDPDLKAATKQTANLKCELCDYITWNNILLECHMNRHHLKVKPYICHICSKAFIGKHLLKKHIDTHKIEKTIVCMICMKKFANSACLKMHLRLHTGEKPFTCEICGDRFRSSSILNVHKLKKHSDKNNACPLCQNKFHTVRDLRRHIIKVHWKEKDKKFNPRELRGLGEEHYHLFHDGRRVKVDKELEF